MIPKKKYEKAQFYCEECNKLYNRVSDFNKSHRAVTSHSIRYHSGDVWGQECQKCFKIGLARLSCKHTHKMAQQKFFQKFLDYEDLILMKSGRIEALVPVNAKRKSQIPLEFEKFACEENGKFKIRGITKYEIDDLSIEKTQEYLLGQAQGENGYKEIIQSSDGLIYKNVKKMIDHLSNGVSEGLPPILESIPIAKLGLMHLDENDPETVVIDNKFNFFTEKIFDIAEYSIHLATRRVVYDYFKKFYNRNSPSPRNLMNLSPLIGDFNQSPNLMFRPSPEHFNY